MHIVLSVDVNFYTNMISALSSGVAHLEYSYGIYLSLSTQKSLFSACSVKASTCKSIFYEEEVLLKSKFNMATHNPRS